MDERAFQIKVAMMRKAQKAYSARSKKGDWKNQQEKLRSLMHRNKLEGEVDKMLEETFGKQQNLFQQ